MFDVRINGRSTSHFAHEMVFYTNFSMIGYCLMFYGVVRRTYHCTYAVQFAPCCSVACDDEYGRCTTRVLAIAL
jgi:hypothetical protein